ncbi:MAG TPA: lysyl oxidase family protein [Fimbriimonadaceae bacterium]|nr:lysyl oxidase family protein [Fimbriimonadaceae bacterium]
MLTALLFAATTSNLILDVLPDAGLWEARLADAYVGTTFSSEDPPNVKAIRMSTVSINRGPGRLELRGGEVVGSQQRVYQRVYRDNGTTYDREAGWFVYHPSHGHIHFEDWTVFRLREMAADGGVGPVIRTGAKTSFCILELDTWDATLPGYNTSPSYSSCGQVQGLRPGRADIYSSSLNGQYIEIVGVPDGIYWLEGEIDPDNLVLEADETNNFARIPIAIGPPPTAIRDPFEDNDTTAEVNSKPEGGLNSPNIGLVLTQKVVKGLSMDDANDYFRIKLHACGPGDYIKMASPYLRQGNLNLRLLNSAGTALRTSTDDYNFEQISLNGIAAGTYYIHVQRATTTNNPTYSLTIEPGGNLPPNITVTQPALPGIWVERSLETFPVAWSGTDPEGDPKFVTIFMDRNRVFGPTNQPVPGYENINGGSGGVNINTVGLGLGKWNVFVRATDGAAFNDVWAPGYVGIYLKGDLDFDGVLTPLDLKLLGTYDPHFTGMPEGYNPIADMNRDGVVNSADFKLLARLF